MNKKKVSALLIAGVLSIGAIGGTLAWFTSQDSVTNAFQTGSTDNSGNTNSGIDIEENFKPEDADNMTPGDTVTKQVWIENTASYDQFVRAKIEKVWKYGDKVVTHYVIGEKTVQDDQGNDVVVETVKYLTDEEAITTVGAQALKYDYIVLNLSSANKWINNNDIKSDSVSGYYYYGEVLQKSITDGDKGKKVTSNLLESVTLSSSADNVYKNLNFDVIVTAESIQAANNAVDSWNKDDIEIPQTIKDLATNYNK